MSEQDQNQQSELQDRHITVNDPGTLEAFQLVGKWHENGLKSINTTLDNAKPGVMIKFGNEPTDADTLLTEELAKGVRIGLVIALSALGKLPFELSQVAEQEEPEEEE